MKHFRVSFIVTALCMAAAGYWGYTHGGVAGMVTADMVKPGAIVLDVGVSRVPGVDGKSKLAGDVALDVREVAAWVAPNPGGVGPMTRAMLLSNVVERAEADLA